MDQLEATTTLTQGETNDQDPQLPEVRHGLRARHERTSTAKPGHNPPQPRRIPAGRSITLNPRSNYRDLRIADVAPSWKTVFWIAGYGSTMKVKDLMARGVGTCRPTDTLGDAAQLMWERDCGCIPVVSEDGSNRVVGMLTDRDICMAAHFGGVSPGALSVGQVMSKAVRTIGAQEKLGDATAAMRDSQVRRLPVVDEDGCLLGLISLADLARLAVGERASKKKKPEITERAIAETLEAICEVRTGQQTGAST